MTVNIHQAKTNLSKLLERVRLGEEIVIAKAGKPVARLAPLAATRRKPELGWAKGRVWMAPDFDAPLPDDLLNAFYNHPVEPRE